ncbi:hypothetical protein IW262DRAFT_1290888 [Armillaria fumosa]|nr:hypothetical protein IW262DRAFT_1290888 [Armillaria fumosa]
MVWGVRSSSTSPISNRFDNPKQFLTGCIFIMCIALSIAEMGSSAPTSGALYYWTFKYSPPPFRKECDGFAFILSLLAPCWTVCGLDSSIYTSEEAWNAPTAVPFAILSSVIVECIIGLGPSLIGVRQILANSLGTGGAVAFWVLVAILLHTSVMDILIAFPRQVFVFSRDGALPLSSLFYKINPYTGTPVNAVYMWSPIIARFFGGQSFTPGPFSLGKASDPVAFVATAFMILMMVVFFSRPHLGLSPKA